MRNSHILITVVAAFLMGACPVCPQGGKDKPDSSGPDPATTTDDGTTTNSIKAIPGGCQTTTGPECTGGGTGGIGGSGSTGDPETTGASTGAPATPSAP